MMKYSFSSVSCVEISGFPVILQKTGMSLFAPLSVAIRCNRCPAVRVESALRALSTGNGQFSPEVSISAEKSDILGSPKLNFRRS